MNQIQRIEQFRKELALAETYDDIKVLDAKASAVAEFARRNKVSKEKQDELGEFRIEIEAKKGAWLDEFFPHGNEKGVNNRESVSLNNSSLQNIGINYNESSNARLISKEQGIVRDVVEQLKKDDKQVVTPYSVQREIRKIKKAEKKESLQKAVDSINDNDSKSIQDIEKGWHKIGNQHLYYGSNTDDEFIGKLPKAKFAFADPPYNAGVDDWDHNFVWQQDYLQDIADVVAVTPGGWNAFGFYQTTKMNYQWEIACWIKNGMTHGRCGYANWIKVSVFGKEKPKIQQDHISIAIRTSETDHTFHKGRKPYPLMANLIEMFSDEGGVIIDPFAGSGTTLLMSEKLNRISYNAELDKQYCIDIINRGIANGMVYVRV